MAKDVFISIGQVPNSVRYARMLMTGTVSVFGPIAIGIAAQSVAMQWAGFLLGTLLFFAWLTTSDPRNRHLTIEQAHKRIDEIAKEFGQTAE